MVEWDTTNISKGSPVIPQSQVESLFGISDEVFALVNEDEADIPRKDCWRTLTFTAQSTVPEQITSNSPAGKDTYVWDGKLALDKKCECLPRGQKPKNYGKKPRTVEVIPAAGGPNYFITQSYTVTLDCEDCDRFIPTGDDTGPYTIQECEPDWGPKTIGTYSVRFEVPTGTSIYDKALTQPRLRASLGGMNGAFNSWMNDNTLTGAEAMGYTQSCCGEPDFWGDN